MLRIELCPWRGGRGWLFILRSCCCFCPKAMQVEHLAEQLEIQKSHVLEVSDYYIALDNSYFNNDFLLKYPQIMPFTVVYRNTVEYKYYKDINSDFCIFRIRMDVGRSWSSQDRVGRRSKKET